MSERAKVVLKIVIALALLQAARFAIKQAGFLLLPQTNFCDRLLSAVAMLLLTGVVLLWSKRQGYRWRFFPGRFGIGYVIATAAFGAFLVATPLITGNTDGLELFLLLYSALVVPLFEETIFRGLLWSRLEGVFKAQWQVYLLSAVLFALWHFGYVDALALRVSDGLLNAMIWKALTGLGFGLVLGLARWKSGNCYASMLLHGFLNVFGG